MPKKYLKEAEETERIIKGLPPIKKAPSIDKIHISDEKMTGNKIESYIKELNANSENIWRLPSIDELKFIRKFYKDELKDAFTNSEWKGDRMSKERADAWSSNFYKDKRSGEIYNTVMTLSDGDLFDFRINSKATCYVLCISDNPKNEEITDDNIDDDSINSMFERRMRRRKRKLTESTSEYTKAFREGYEQGYEDGYEDGYDDGYGA